MTKKQDVEERVYLAYTLASSLVIEESQDRNMEGKADAKAMERSCLLACSHVL